MSNDKCPMPMRSAFSTFSAVKFVPFVPIHKSAGMLRLVTACYGLLRLVTACYGLLRLVLRLRRSTIINVCAGCYGCYGLLRLQKPPAGGEKRANIDLSRR